MRMDVLKTIAFVVAALSLAASLALADILLVRGHPIESVVCEIGVIADGGILTTRAGNCYR